MIILEIKAEDQNILNSFMENDNLSLSVIKPQGITDFSNLIQVVVPLSGIAATLIYKLVKEQIRSKRYIKVKYKDFQITGVEEDKIIKFLEYIISETKKLEEKK